MTVVTRIAPSPTGDPHVGTAYVALLNYCFAKKHGGRFILRIEDTDQQRSTAESETMILDALKWLGLSWDEGPDIGGPSGPYRQSDRSQIYAEHAQQLLDQGHAFHCFCTADRLNAMRAQQREQGGGRMGYDGACLQLSQDEVQDKLNAQEPSVVRLKVPNEGSCIVPDLARGDIEIAWEQVDMQVLVKSDGLPTYHLANVVDDHLMGVTHVIRGEEWISSAPKHVLLYQAFGWEVPTICHLPLLRNPDKSKLSKRKNPTSILWYQRMGVLPEALLNYLGLMAWSHPSGEERFDLGSMVEAFDLERINLAGPVFDLTKLKWLSGRWVREVLDEDDFARRVRDWTFNDSYLNEVFALAKSRTEFLSDLGSLTSFFFRGGLEPETDSFDLGSLEKDQLRKALFYVLKGFDAEPTWSTAVVEQTFRRTATLLDIKLKALMPPFYQAITGAKTSVPLFDAAGLLGRDITRHRLREALIALDAPSKKEMKRWDKEWQVDWVGAENSS